MTALTKNNLSWYIKWFSSIILIVALILRSNQIFPIWDLGLSCVGCLGWLVVGWLWKDRALIVLNTVAHIILLSGLINQLVIK